MSKRGKRIQSATKSFGKANRQIGSTLGRLNAAIRERKIGPKERKLFREFYASLHDQFELFVGKRYTTTGKKADFKDRITACIMNVEQDHTGEIDYGLFSPAYIQYSLNETAFAVESRKFPLAFTADHVEFRFNQNPDKKLPLRYTAEQLAHTMISALLLSRILPEVDLLYGNDITPIVLPHQDGLFFGYAQTVDPSIYDFTGSVIQKKKNQLKAVQGEAPPGETSWAPSCRMIIKTFVPTKNLRENQQRLRQAMFDLIVSDKNQPAIRRMGQPYITRFNSIDQNAPDLLALENAAMDIIESSDWDIMKHYGQKHLPTNKCQTSGNNHS